VIRHSPPVLFSLLLGLVVLAAGTATAGTATAGAAQPAGWSSPAKVPGTRLLLAVSCPSTTFCMAVGDGDAVAYGGGRWSSPKPIDRNRSENGGLVTVSCVSDRFCMAGDGSGDAVGFDGSSWSRPVLVSSAGLAQLSCATTRFCLALDTNGDAAVFDGSTWSAPRPIPGSSQPLFVACATSSFCMAIDGNAAGAYRFDGHRWQTAGQLDVSNPTGGSEPNVGSGVACPSARFCAALDDFGEAFVWSGSSWSGPHSFDPALLTASDAVSCASARFCQVVDERGLATAWNGRSWSPARRIDPTNDNLADVSCPSNGFCVAVDASGRALYYR